MPVYDGFAAARKEARAVGYLVPGRMKDLVELLRRQGVAVEVTTRPVRTQVQVFAVEALSVDSLFEGHRPLRAEGQWRHQSVDSSVVAGWYLVRTDQPLGTLAAYLLEPASEDGVVTWNLLDRELKAPSVYPILRVEAGLPPSVLAP
jgi:dipeptidyl-peptidase-4